MSHDRKKSSESETAADAELPVLRMTPPADHVVNVDIPLSISHDKGRMEMVMANVLRHLGCGGCHSGWDIRFRHIRDLVVDAKTLDVNARGAIVER